jgi:transcriptional regulator with XRE-family HTH domain
MERDSRPDSPQAIGKRLRLIRIAYGVVQGRIKELSQAEFCRLCDITTQAWNNAETGDNRIGLDSAMAVWSRTGADLNYIYGGERAGLPLTLGGVIEKLEKGRSSKHAEASPLRPRPE